MDKNSTAVSLQLSNGTANSSTEQEDTWNKIEHAYSMIRVMRSRMILLRAKLKEAVKQERERTTQMRSEIDVSNTTKNYRESLEQLWIAIENIQIKTAGLKTVAYNMVTHDILRQQQSQLSTSDFHSSAVRGFMEKIVSLSYQFESESENLKELCEQRNNEMLRSITCQKQLIKAQAQLPCDIESDNKSQANEKRKEIGKRRVIKVVIARDVINSLLCGMNADYIKYPDLLRIKIESRPS